MVQVSATSRARFVSGSALLRPEGTSARLRNFAWRTTNEHDEEKRVWCGRSAVSRLASVRTVSRPRGTTCSASTITSPGARPTSRIPRHASSDVRHAMSDYPLYVEFDEIYKPSPLAWRRRSNTVRPVQTTKNRACSGAIKHGWGPPKRVKAKIFQSSTSGGYGDPTASAARGIGTGISLQRQTRSGRG